MVSDGRRTHADVGRLEGPPALVGPRWPNPSGRHLPQGDAAIESVDLERRVGEPRGMEEVVGGRLPTGPMDGHEGVERERRVVVRERTSGRERRRAPPRVGFRGASERASLRHMSPGFAVSGRPRSAVVAVFVAMTSALAACPKAVPDDVPPVADAGTTLGVSEASAPARTEDAAPVRTADDTALTLDVGHRVLEASKGDPAAWGCTLDDEGTLTCDDPRTGARQVKKTPPAAAVALISKVVDLERTCRANHHPPCTGMPGRCANGSLRDGSHREILCAPATALAELRGYERSAH